MNWHDIAVQHVENKKIDHVVDKYGIVRRPKNRLPYAGKVYGAEEVAALLNEAERFWLTEGDRCAAFASCLTFMVKAPTVLCNSGSSANLLAISTLMQRDYPDALRCGDRVLTTSLGFPTTVAPLMQLGLEPVLIDVDLDTWNATPELVARALMHDKSIRGAVLAHTLGNPFDAEGVGAVLEGRHFIEDACDALGSSIWGRRCGTFGDMATFSFYPPHHITTGEGGAVVCQNDRSEKIVRSLRDWGRDCDCRSGQNNRCGHRFDGSWGFLPPGYDHKFVYARAGYNLKMTDLQAAVGCVQFSRLESFADARARNWETWREALRPAIERGLVAHQVPTRESTPSWFGFGLRLTGDAPPRRQVVQQLAAQGIDTRHPFAGSLQRQPGFSHLRADGALTATDELCERAFFVGVYPGLSGNDVRTAAAALLDLLHV